VEARVQAAIGVALGAPVAGARRIEGGDINEAYEIALADGRRLFAKTNRRSPRGMFAAEARGLAWLAGAQALRVPSVIAVSAEAASGQATGQATGEEAGPQFLILELVASSAPAPDFDERLGLGLAALHRAGAPGFGLDHDNFIGRLAQENTPAPDWASFYRARRLEAQLGLAVDGGLATPRMRRGFERLWGALDRLVGPPEPPARLHGDLWGGNLLCDERGHPCLIDPAVYGGHREVDLAMMRLFGGFGSRVFDAYRAAWPLADGHRERIALYQLYPLMVHVNLFGGGYLGSVESALDRLV
jgi:fructosamine-3-kinase